MNMPQNNSRRDFLRQSAVCGAGAVLAGASDAFAEQRAAIGNTQTYASRDRDGTITQGGHSTRPGSMTNSMKRMWMTIGERRFSITLSDNDAARAFATQVPLTLDMSELNGNEKYAQLPKALPADASRPGTIRNGDLMLYGKDTVVIFYSTFQSSYSYTRLGHVDDAADLPQALGRRGVRVVFSKETNNSDM
jgi:hypothetical protein